MGRPGGERFADVGNRRLVAEAREWRRMIIEASPELYIDTKKSKELLKRVILLSK